MPRYWLSLSILSLLLWTGCSSDRIPVRNAEFKEPKEVIQSYYDYRRLENAGVETVRLKSKHLNRTVSLAFYLYLIAQAFERFDRDNDAVKLYLRMLTNFPLIHEGGQLGVMAENRLHWLLGDKSWVSASLDDLILRLEQALRMRDFDALSQLISRDFGFGRNYNERFAVKYQDGLELLGRELKTLSHPAVEVVMKIEDEKVLLKTTGWEEGKKVWYFGLHKNQRRHGWEWDMAYWEPENDSSP